MSYFQIAMWVVVVGIGVAMVIAAGVVVLLVLRHGERGPPMPGDGADT